VKAVAALAGALLVVMIGALVYGFTQGDGWSEVRTLTGFPWFNVTIVDVYVGFILFAVWIGYRERPLPAAAWIVALMALGNALAALYALIAALRAHGDWSRFWLGRHAPQAG
jgi:hypothetical protein